MSFRLARPAFNSFRASSIIAKQLPIPISTRLFTTTSSKMTVHIFETEDQFKEAIAKNDVVIIDAFATWCGPCKAIAPQIAKWAESEDFKDKVYFGKFDVDHLPELAQELGIRAMPTFLFFKNGEKVDEFLGANPPQILNLLKKHSSEESAE
ncbi:cytoplasmic thioredoxin isoenzyme 2 [Podospora fimiseda]|uniref:Cytoplasmic thioredoxin isoenzyme 2 n=1 Tax=Podospora fimiseda TaxID=252190 RepID=A0AAN7H6H6_9PEZI|nr:cytoplasmic thioredoxin isoenzyme 2 [Podospora fimiseda]